MRKRDAARKHYALAKPIREGALGGRLHIELKDPTVGISIEHKPRGNVDFFRQYLLDRRVNLPNIVAANTTAFPSLNLGTLPWKP